MASDCVSSLHLGDSGIPDLHQQAISPCDTATWNQPSGSPGHPLPIVVYETSVHHHYRAFSHYPQEDSIVWLYDASVPIRNLMPFFIAALIFMVFLFVPYTLLLLLGQWVWTKSDYKLIKSCWAKHPRLKLCLKAILDPYHAPYEPEHCYWTGLLLLLRCLLLLVSALNISGEKDSVNLLAILSTVCGTLVLVGLSERIYKNWYRSSSST